MNYLEITLILISILLVIRGFYQGILRMSLSLVGFILAFVVINALNPMIYSALYGNKIILNKTYEISERYTNSNKNIGKINKNFDKKDNSDFIMSGLLREKVLSKLDKVDLRDKDDDTISNEVKNAVKDSTADLILKGTAMFLAMLLASTIFLIIKIIVHLIGSIPIIRGASKLLGAFIGLIEAFFLICFVIFLIQCFSTTKQGRVLYKEYSESNILKSINEMNPLYNIF